MKVLNQQSLISNQLSKAPAITKIRFLFPVHLLDLDLNLDLDLDLFCFPQKPQKHRRNKRTSRFL